jgi:hypothetical protein
VGSYKYVPSLRLMGHIRKSLDIMVTRMETTNLKEEEEAVIHEISESLEIKSSVKI